MTETFSNATLADEHHFSCDERSDAQWIARKVTLGSSGLLSTAGSLLIIFIVATRSTSKLTTVKNRILVAMSSFDVFASIAWALSTAPIPRGSDCTYGAIGNNVTCVIQGCMMLLGHCVPLYNAVLCIYFYLIIVHDVQDSVIAKYELTMHLAAILPILVAITLALFFGKINNYSILCYLADEDGYELDIDGKEKKPSTILNILIGYGTVIGILSFVIIVFSMIKVYLFVKRKERKMSKYDFKRNSNMRKMHVSNEESRGTNNNTAAEEKENKKGFFLSRLWTKKNPQSATIKSSTLSETVHDTKVQAYLYVLSFLVTHLSSMVLVIVEKFFVNPPYPIMIIHGVLSPLQGFWNFLIYITPRVKTVSKKYPGTSFLRRLYVAIFVKTEDQNDVSSPVRGSPYKGDGILRSTPNRRRSMIARIPAHHADGDNDDILLLNNKNHSFIDSIEGGKNDLWEKVPSREREKENGKQDLMKPTPRHVRTHQRRYSCPELANANSARGVLTSSTDNRETHE